MNCKQCGAILKEGSLFCSQCGQSTNPQNDLNFEYSVPSHPSYEQPSTAYSNNPTNNIQTNSSPKKSHSTIPKILLLILIAILSLIAGFFVGSAFWRTVENTPISSSSDNNRVSTIPTSQANSINSSNSSNNSSRNNSNNTSSYITTSNGTKISFIVENTLKEAKSYSNETYRCFDKTVQEDTSSIYIKESYVSATEYWESISSKSTTLTSSSNYSNVQLSTPRTLTVNDKTFTCQVIKYQYGDTTIEDVYIAYELGNESLYTIEIENYDLITKTELEGLLTITIEN